MSDFSLLCPVAEACGGCPQIGLSATQQRAAKLQQICDLAQVRGVKLPALEWLADENEGGYRNRVRLRLDKGVPLFFNEQKSSECAVLRHELRAALPQLRVWALGQGDALSAFTHLELRAPDADGVAALTLFFTAERRAAACAAKLLPFQEWLVFREAWPERENGPAAPLQRLALADDVYTYVPVTGFMQVNSGVNQRMVALVRQIALGAGASTFLDLFCGSGNLSLPLLKDGLRGAGAEIDAAAISALKRAAQEQKLDAANFIAADARGPLFSGRSFDLLITDPPRAGLKGVVGTLSELHPATWVLCHCSLLSFVRDATELVAAGFELERVVAIDMFPHTAQIELLSVLRGRRDRAR